MGKSETIGPAEMRILRHLSEFGAKTVREVADSFSESDGLARTTVLTFMERLRKKKYLTRSKRNGVFVYQAKTSKQELLKGLVRTFVNTTLGGAIQPFVAYLQEGAAVSSQDLAELKRLVKLLESQSEKDGP